MTAYEVLLLVITAAGLAGCLFFVIRYWLTTKGAWRRSEAGRFLMIVQANLGALFLLVMINQIFGPGWPGQKILTIVLFTTYVAETWWPVRLLIKAQAKKR